MERPSGQLQPDPCPQAKLDTSRLLVSFQYLHVQLAGGAPWGFTLRGGLEHGEPLIVSKVEDGGKASLSQKMRSGDELVNINGTPLYGSRQEALILIKGSYRALKMIIRR
uniref:PDZ domain-containing protein n=2 Tax=Pseudonaja textilis TaxID=8673 RepID=A0A670YJ31_PSETE